MSESVIEPLDSNLDDRPSTSSMISFWRQLRYLLWKGVLIKKRQKIWLAIEILVPIILFAILALVRTRDFTVEEPQCHYDSKGYPSAGLLPFLHSFLCSFSNNCHASPSTGDEGFYINNITNTNESIIVDFLYYSSLELQFIGENPAAFEIFMKELSDLIRLLASIDVIRLDMPLVKELFSPTTNLTSQLVSMGVTQKMAEQLSQARITSILLVELNAFKDELDSLLVTLLFDDPTIPFLCNRTRFDNSFILSNGSHLTSADFKSLCKITVSKLMTSGLMSQITFDNVMIPLVNGSSMRPTRMITLFNSVMNKSQEHPFNTFMNKYSTITKQSVVNLLFCGVDPFSQAEEQLKPKRKGPETPFDKAMDQLTKYVAKASPGQEKTHDKEFCNSVRIQSNNSCSSIGSAVLHQVKALVSGYILVTPPSPIVQQLVDKLNDPLRHVDYFRNLLLEYPSLADPLQAALFNSDLYLASQNLLKILQKSRPPISPQLETFEFILEHIFNNSSDPYSFGNITRGIVDGINQYSTCFLTNRFVIVANETDLEDTAVCLMEYDQYFTGLVFNVTSTSDSLPPFTSYKIRHNPQYVDDTQGVMDSAKRVFDRNQPFRDLKYLTYGFVFLQEAVNKAIISIRTNESIDFGIYAQQEPYPCVSTDDFNVSNFIGLFMMLSFLIPAALLVKNIVYEKEHKLKEQMRIMGLGDAVHFISWAIISIVLNFISVVLIALLLKYGQILDSVNFWLLIVFLYMFALSSISMSLFFSTMFNNANIATAAMTIIYFLFFFPFQLSVKSKNKAFSQFTMIFPQTVLGYGSLIIGSFDDVTWDNLDNLYLTSYNVSLVQCMIAFAVQTVVFCILSWYISAIAPGVYGVSQPWYFPLTKKYWFPKRKAVVDDSEEPFDAIPVNDDFELEPTDMKMSVHINHMSKVYPSGTKALNNLSLRLYENNITALLGHNGAGKTTTMSMLCGLYTPSSGTASIYGNDIRTDMRGVRDNLGVCPQYNVLFHLLTVYEQLFFFAALKGVPDNKIPDAVTDILKSVHLEEKSSCLAHTLSGGMKRRLCIGIALIGDSKFVILDEPTAGVDVNSRKDIWTLLQQNKHGRTILLSTHHMDEADVLSDRVAILSSGSLIALGSPVFLKNRYGQHLMLTACKMEKRLNYRNVVEKLLAESTIPIEKGDENEAEVIFKIPLNTSSQELEVFFSDFDQKLSSYKFNDYGISAPTLQQIFVSLAPHADYKVPKQDMGCLAKIKRLFGRKATVDVEDRTPLHDSRSPNTNTVSINDEYDFDVPPPITGFQLVKNHVRALLTCRCQYTLRSKKIIFFEVIMPILLLFACELYTLVTLHNSTSSYVLADPPLPMVDEVMGNFTDTYLNVLDRNQSTYSYKLMESMTTDPGMGTRCVDSETHQLSPYFSIMAATANPHFHRRSALYRRFKGLTCMDGIANGTWIYDLPDRSNISYNENVTCECATTVGWNCTAEDYPLESINYVMLNTTERLWDFSHRNLSQFRMDTRWSLTGDTLFMGGFSMGHHNLRARSEREIIQEYNGWYTLMTALSDSSRTLNINISSIVPSSPYYSDPFSQNITFDIFLQRLLRSYDTEENAKIWFNNKIWPSVSMYTSNIYNSLLRIADTDESPDNLGIVTINQPMNETVSDALDQNAFQKVTIFRITIIMLVLCVIPAGFTVFLVQDRITDSFHLQVVSGLSRKTYWSTGYFFDMVTYILAVIIIMLIYIIFNIQTFTYNATTFFSFFLLFILYGFCYVLWCYILQRFFVIPALSFVLISIGSFFVGIVCSMTVIMIEALMRQDPTLGNAYTICSYVFLIVPQYNLGMAIYRGSFVYQIAEKGEMFLNELNRPDLISGMPIPYIMQWNLVGIHCCVLLAHTFVAAFLLAILESGSVSLFRRREKKYTAELVRQYQMEEDEDVQKEINRVQAIDVIEAPPLLVNSLAKAYSSSHLAVRGVSFAVEKGECFGLLGLNGAGKTSTFSILTGKLKCDSGSVHINGYKISDGEYGGFAQTGYCPQFDALNSQLTTKENLVFYARIRGVPEDYIDKIATRLLLSLHLKSYSATITGSLSGGNKRKLSVAIALISQPSLILLDEPSAGMDPGSQQFLWKVIDKLRKMGKAVVMTSHSMEECEALCTRIAIMDEGKIRCLGSKQHLKNKFGEGYSLTFKLRHSVDAESACNRMKELLPAVRVESIHCATVFFHIHRSAATISIILKHVNTVKNEYKIEDFSLSQSTLDEVFQSLSAKKQLPKPTSVPATPSSDL